MGVSTAYHLARLGARGSSCSSATPSAPARPRWPARHPHQYANRLGIELTTHSIVTYERFREEFASIRISASTLLI